MVLKACVLKEIFLSQFLGQLEVVASTFFVGI